VKLICQLGFRSHIPLYDIGYSASIHHQPFWHLQGDRFGSVSPDMVDRFMYLEVIVAGQSWDSQLYHPSEIYQDGSIQLGIVQDVVGYLVSHPADWL
jgi:hypothetical protein